MRLVIAACMLIFFSSFAQAADFKYDSKLVSRMEKYMNSMKTFSANFTQYDSLGNKRLGRVYVSKPGKLRFEYFTPEKELILYDEESLFYYNYDLDEPTFVPTGDMPLYLLTRRSINIAKSVVDLETKEAKNKYILVMTVAHQRFSGKVAFGFDKSTFALTDISTIDSGGYEANLQLSNLEVNKPIPASTFAFSRPQ